jgi:serine O-acetyltransferase
VIGANSRIGANAVVVKSVPPNSVVVGVPGQVVVRSQPRDETIPDLEHNRLPDMIGVTLTSLLTRVEDLEGRIIGHETETPHPHPPEKGAWDGADFSI